MPLLVFTLMAGSNAELHKPVPLPQLPPGPIDLRVAYVVNPRLPRMRPEQLRILLSAMRTTAREHFGVTLRFAPIDEISITTLVEQIPAGRWQELRKLIYDFKDGTGDPKRLAKSFGKELKQSAEPLPAMIEYVRPYVGELSDNSYESLGAALANLQLHRIDRWRQIKAPDGAPAIDASPYNEFMMWLALGYGEVPYEIVLTNQAIVSVEYGSVAMSSAIRGGYSNGITTYNKRAHYGTYSIWSTFAFTVDDRWVKELRGGETYAPEEAARLAGVAATHELGHQLFHLLHPYGQNACVMNPVPLLGYRAWAEKLSAKDCPLGSSPAMRPGVYQFRY